MSRNLLCKVTIKFLLISFCGEEKNYSCFSFTIRFDTSFLCEQLFCLRFLSHTLKSKPIHLNDGFVQEHKVNSNLYFAIRLFFMFCCALLFRFDIICLTYERTLVELLMCRFTEWMKYSWKICKYQNQHEVGYGSCVLLVDMINLVFFCFFWWQKPFSTLNLSGWGLSQSNFYDLINKIFRYWALSQLKYMHMYRSP